MSTNSEISACVEVSAGVPEWDMGIDVPASVPLLAPARRIVAILAALGAEEPVEVVAAHAECSSVVALRHLQHLARIGLAEQGTTGAGCFRASAGPGPFRPAALTRDGHARAIAWYIECVFEAARVLGALALPTGEQVTPDPARPPRGFADRRAALAWFVGAREALQVVLESADELGLDTHAWRLALLMLNVTCFTGPLPQWRIVFERGLAAARRARHASAEAMLQEAAGKLELTGGDPVAARERHYRALVIRSTRGDRRGLVRSLNTIGVSFLRGGLLREAGELFAWSCEQARDLGDDEFLAYGLMNAGAVHARLGPPDVAVKELEEALALLHAGGRDVYVANALEDLAVAHRANGDPVRAEHTVLEAIDAAIEAQVPMFLPGPLIECAAMNTDKGHLRIARAQLHEALGIYTEIGDEIRARRVHTQLDRLARVDAPQDGDHGQIETGIHVGAAPGAAHTIGALG